MTAFFCQAGARRAPSLPLRGSAFLLPRGWRCSLVPLRAGLATPPRATRQRFPACGPSASVRDSRAVSPRQSARRGPARSGERAPPTLGAGFSPTHALPGPARSGAMAPTARGAEFTATLASAMLLHSLFIHAGLSGLLCFAAMCHRALGGGHSIRQAGASGHGSRDRGDPARGPRRGVGDAVSCGHRGAPERDALLGRG
jgi:hypothetical protein